MTDIEALALEFELHRPRLAGGHIAEVTALVDPDRLRRLDLSAVGA